MREKSGTTGYMAPEIGKGGNLLIGPEIDMWAFGVLLYELCTSYKPTQVRNYYYGSGPIPFAKRDWQNHENNGELLQDLIQKCLQTDPAKRISAADALQHQWFKSGESELKQRTPDDQLSLSNESELP